MSDCILPLYWDDTHLGRYALNDRLGTAEDLKALADALHERDMYLMVDVVANHMVGVMVQAFWHWLTCRR